MTDSVETTEKTQTSGKISDRVMYFYHRDPENKQRVLTIARRVVDGNVYYGVAVNRPIEWKRTEDTRNRVVEERVGDSFDKIIGRDMAILRMETGRTNPKRKRSNLRGAVQYKEGENPLVSVLRTLHCSKNSVVRRIAKDALANRSLKKAIKGGGVITSDEAAAE
jgi:hypothetical protein